MGKTHLELFQTKPEVHHVSQLQDWQELPWAPQLFVLCSCLCRAELLAVLITSDTGGQKSSAGTIFFQFLCT